MSSTLKNCLQRLHLNEDKKLESEAQEIIGRFYPLPPKLFNKGPNCKPVIAIHLAYESLQMYDWNIKLAAELAGCSVKAYESVLSTVRKQLNIYPSVKLSTLAVALGSTTMQTYANTLWDDFIKRYKDTLTGAKKSNIDDELKLSCWKGAVMFCCAKAFGDKLNKDKLYQLCSCSLTELNRCIKIVNDVCSKQLAKFKEQKSTTSKKKRLVEEAEEETNKSRKRANTTPVSGIVSMIDHRDYKSTRRYRDYTAWHTRMIDQLKLQISNQ
ncbi:hypothetical protein G6F49_008181 [Rhizopus delemar]|nr:hypothetical protein G6F49_008181 [Rhizopus delemar]